VLSTSFAEWRDRMGAGRAVRLAVEEGKIAKDRGTAWLEELQGRDLRGRFTATGMFFMVAGSRPA